MVGVVGTLIPCFLIFKVSSVRKGNRCITGVIPEKSIGFLLKAPRNDKKGSSKKEDVSIYFFKMGLRDADD